MSHSCPTRNRHVHVWRFTDRNHFHFLKCRSTQGHVMTQKNLQNSKDSLSYAIINTRKRSRHGLSLISSLSIQQFSKVNCCWSASNKSNINTDKAKHNQLTAAEIKYLQYLYFLLNTTFKCSSKIKEGSKVMAALFDPVRWQLVLKNYIHLV